MTLELANPHGDLLATAADDPAASAVASYSESTEYGAPRTPATAPDSYGWIGAQQRSADDLGGLTLMGVRLYNPTTARFLTVDPIPGGNDNAYVYPVNPIDSSDISGRSWTFNDYVNGYGYRDHGFAMGTFGFQIASGQNLQWYLRFKGLFGSEGTMVHVSGRMTVNGRGTSWQYNKTGYGNYFFHSSIGNFKYHGDAPWTSHFISAYRSVYISIQLTISWYNHYSCGTFYVTENLHFTSNEY